jgi:streptogramin lyase
MWTRPLLPAALAGLGFSLLVTGGAAAATVLTGQVSSIEEGHMEGVVVSAKREGARITVSVVSDAQGRYSFPGSKLEPGHYALAVRAVGYDLEAPRSVDIPAGSTANLDIRLVKTKNLPAQLTNAEWLASMPGTDGQKKSLLNCVNCHTLERIVRSTHDAAEFLQVFERMAGYYQGSTPEYPQRFADDVPHPPGPEANAMADYLASINLSKSDRWRYALKTYRRPTGRATHVVVTEYELPRRQIQPHDVIVDAGGTVWFSHFGEPLLSRMDPGSGEVTDFPLPVLKKNLPVGTLDLEADRDGNLWIGMMQQGGIARFDTKTGTVQAFPVPPQWQDDGATFQQATAANSHVDGKVWSKNSEGNQLLRLDLGTGKWENLGAFKDPATNRNIAMYGMPSDRQNNVYLLDIAGGNIGRLDAKTLKLSVYRTPIPNSRPRRGRVDAQDRLWFGEYGGNAIGMFDPQTERILEWRMPTPWAEPYDVAVDQNGMAWTGSMLSDRVSRLDPKSGEIVEYLLPHPTNIRRVFVDDRTTPVTFWVGNTHGASIVKLEPTD